MSEKRYSSTALLHHELTQLEERREKLLLKRHQQGAYADPTRMVEKEIQSIEAEMLRLTRELAAIQAADDARDRAAQDDEATFWFRRFFTSVAIANGAAFAALAAGFLNTDDKAAIANALAEIMSFFAIGMCTAGLIPALLWARVKLGASQSKSKYLAFSGAMGALGGAAIVTFVMGIFFCIKAVASFA